MWTVKEVITNSRRRERLSGRVPVARICETGIQSSVWRHSSQHEMGLDGSTLPVQWRTSGEFKVSSSNSRSPCPPYRRFDTTLHSSPGPPPRLQLPGLPPWPGPSSTGQPLRLDYRCEACLLPRVAGSKLCRRRGASGWLGMDWWELCPW